MFAILSKALTPTFLKAQLLYVTCATSDKDWHSMEHSHYFSELFFVTKGTGYFQIEGKQIPVQKNDLILINPNIPHTEFGNKEQPWEYIALGIEGVQFQYSEKEAPYSYSVFSLSREHREIPWYLSTLVKEIQTQQEGYQTICQNLLELILLSVARSTRQDFSLPQGRKPPENADWWSNTSTNTITKILRWTH